MDNNSTAATPVNVVGGSGSGGAVEVEITAPLPLPIFIDAISLPVPVTTTPAFPNKRQIIGGAFPAEQVVVSAVACELQTLTGYNSDSDTETELFVQLHEAGAVPLAPGAIPLVIIPVKGRQTFSLSQNLEFPELVLAISTTEFTFTGAGDVMVYQATFGIAP